MIWIFAIGSFASTEQGRRMQLRFSARGGSQAVGEGPRRKRKSSSTYWWVESGSGMAEGGSPAVEQGRAAVAHAAALLRRPWVAANGLASTSGRWGSSWAGQLGARKGGGGSSAAA